MFILNYFSQTNVAGDDCEPPPKRLCTVDDASRELLIVSRIVSMSGV